MSKREIWKPIPGYLNYKVSDRGRVKSIDRYDSKGQFRKGQILKPIKNKYGYMKVNLCENGSRRDRKVHQLVASAFIGDCPKGKQVNHIDEDRTNNCVDNLEYLTPKENCNYGRHRERISASNRGRKRSEKGRLAIKSGARKRLKNVMCIETGIIYESAEDAQKAIGISSGVKHVCLGINKTAGGYHWRYV